MGKLGHHIKAGAKKIGAKLKGGVHIKAKVGVKGKAKPIALKAGAKGKAKVGLKLKAGAKGKAKVAAKPKVAVKGKLAVKPKLKVKAKVGVKHRRLQAPKDGFQPPLKPATPAKKDDNKPATPAKKDDKKDDNVDTTVTTNKDGLPVSEYSKDVTVPADLEGSSDQTAPKSSNLIKFAFMLFAAFMTMY